MQQMFCSSWSAAVHAISSAGMVQVNNVGFYQLSKLCITPAVMAVECVRVRRQPPLQEVSRQCFRQGRRLFHNVPCTKTPGTQALHLAGSSCCAAVHGSLPGNCDRHPNLGQSNRIAHKRGRHRLHSCLSGATCSA